MPRYRIEIDRPATYREIYIVDAGSAEEASRAYNAGRATIKKRQFATTGTSKDQHVIEDDVSVSPIETQPTLPEFANATFSDRPGALSQTVVQVFEE